MPTIKNILGPYRFFFYSFDCNEPEHVHVQRDSDTCKFWLTPLALAKNNGFSSKEIFPLSGATNPAKTLKAELFPAPLGPISAVILPSVISKSIPFKIL